MTSPASTPPPTPQDRRALVAEKARARRARTRALRRRIAAGATAMFIALFAGITIQMASGNDPVVTNTTTAAQSTQASASPAGATSANGSARSDTSAATTGSNASSSSASQPASVTTQQS